MRDGRNIAGTTQPAGAIGSFARVAFVLAVCVAAVALAVYHVASNVRSSPAAASRIETSRQVFDFGEVAEGTVVKHAFKLTNTGSLPVTISTIRSSCPCLSHKVSQTEIPPGAAADVTVELNTTEMSGPAHYLCLVSFENPRMEPLKFDVKGYVFTPSALFSAGRVDFGDVLAGNAATRTLRIINKDYKSAKWTIVSAKASSAFLDAEYRREIPAITVSVSPNAPVGPVESGIVVTIRKVDREYSITIPVAADIVGPLKALPKRLFLGKVESDRLCAKEVVIVKADKAFGGDVPTLVKAAGLELKESGNGRYLCATHIRAPSEPGFFRGEIVIQTNLGTDAALHIPYAGLVGK